MANATILLIDQQNTPQEVQAFAIQRIAKFVETRRKGDRIGIYTLLRGGSLHVVQDLTDDSELLQRAAKTLKSRDPNQRTSDTGGMAPHEVEGYMAMSILGPAMDTKRALEEIARHVSRLPGRKSLIWVTTAFPLFDPELGLDFRPDMEKAARALNDAGVALYAVDARGLTFVDDPSGLDTMFDLAGLTGGLVFHNDNGIEDLIQTAVDDGEVTYTLGFYPLRQEQRALVHNLKVKVARRGVSVRYRKSYLASGVATAANDRPKLEELLRDPLDATQLELVARTAPDRARPGSWRIDVNVDLHDLALEHENGRRSGGVDVSFYVEGSGTARTRTLNIDIPDDRFAALLEQGIDTAAFVDLAAGVQKYVRVVVQDRATGAAGSVSVPLGKR